MDDKNLVKYMSKERPRTYAAALELAVNAIKEHRRERGIDLKRKYILFVPDKYTLLAEKMLYSGGGAFDIEALTLNRLYFRLADAFGGSGKPLSRLGAVLTVRSILGERAGELKAFGKSARYAGFGETVYDNICQLASSGLSPDDLPDDAGGVTGLKVHDLKLVYTEYERATDGKYVDATGRLLLLEKLLPSAAEFFADTEAYFACFDGFTPLLGRIVGKICELCRAGGGDAVICDADIKLDIKGDVEEYAASSRADELKAAAVRIRNLVRGGARYRDMGVIAPSADYNRLKRIFDEYGIPFFTDRKYALSSHPLARYVLDMFSAAHRDSNEIYLRLAKNPYSGIDRHDADVFENYMLYCALGEGAMRFPFAVDPVLPALENSREIAERVRSNLYGRVSSLRKEKISSGVDLARAVAEIIPPDEAKISANVTSPLADAREKILSAVAVLGEIFHRDTRADKLLDALEECFSLSTVSVLPNLSDTVTVGETQVFRAGGFKYLFVLDAHDGEVPAVMRDDGILSDYEIDALARCKARIEPKIETLNRKAEEEFYSVVSSCKHLFLAYCEGETPSRALAEIKACAKKRGTFVASSSDDERARLLDSSGVSGKSEGDDFAADKIDDGLLVKLCPTREAARELYLIGKSRRDAGAYGIGFESELLAALGGVPSFAHVGKVRDAKKLYSHRNMSVSRVQEYFACPFRCFLRYGLKLSPRPTGEVSPLDLGTFLHKVIEVFISQAIKSGDYACTPERIGKIVASVTAEFPQMLRGASEGFTEELTEEAERVTRAVVAQIEKGDFRPVATEAQFGFSDEGLDGITVTVDGERIVLGGVIDRLDVTKCGNAARVIDYKTGRTEFTFADVYYGRKIQLPIYLKVVRENGYTPAGMFYFPFYSDFTSDESSYRLSGIFDIDYAAETDGGFASPQYSSSVVNARSAKDSASGAIVLRKGGSAVTSDELNAVCDYAGEVFTLGACEMLSGYCEPVPLGGAECAYCDLKSVCSAFGGKRYERRKLSVGKDCVCAAVRERDVEEAK